VSKPCPFCSVLLHLPLVLRFSSKASNPVPDDWDSEDAFSRYATTYFRCAM